MLFNSNADLTLFNANAGISVRLC